MNNYWRIFFDVCKDKYYLFLHANGKVVKCEIARAMYEELNNILNIKEEEKMTSRELFKKWKEWIIFECPCDRNDINELEQIEKDLEVLELLKSKHVDIAELKEDDNVVTYNMSMMNQDRLSEEEFKMLKERIEDD